MSVIFNYRILRQMFAFKIDPIYTVFPMLNLIICIMLKNINNNNYKNLSDWAFLLDRN